MEAKYEPTTVPEYGEAVAVTKVPSGAILLVRVQETSPARVESLHRRLQEALEGTTVRGVIVEPGVDVSVLELEPLPLMVGHVHTDAASGWRR